MELKTQKAIIMWIMLGIMIFIAWYVWTNGEAILDDPCHYCEKKTNNLVKCISFTKGGALNPYRPLFIINATNLFINATDQKYENHGL